MKSNALPVVAGDAIDLDTFVQGFNRGFRDYKYGATFDAATMRQFLERSGIERADCAVLLAQENGTWCGVGIALLAVDGDEAWCGGLAVAPPYRRGGAGRRLMQCIQARARARGAQILRLEVLSWNEPARALYASLGYEELRELLIWKRPSAQGALPIPYERLQEMDPVQIINNFYHWHDLPLAWQRRRRFLRRSAERMTGYTIPAKDGLPVGYVLCRAAQDDGGGRMLHIFDVAVDPAADLLDAGRPLLQALQVRYIDHDLRLINEPVDSKLNRIFAALHFRVADRQYELALNLVG